MCINQQGTCENNLWGDEGYQRSYDEWIRYFECNNRHLMNIQWDDQCHLTPGERKAIEKSIAIFQLGEGTECLHFLKEVAAFAQQRGQPRYLEAMKLFVAEEKRHAESLGHFMTIHRIPFIKRTWTQVFFHYTGGKSGLYLCTVLATTAELIANVYYKALFKATHSNALKTICRQILRDEKQHIFIQCSTLAKLFPRKSLWHLAAHEIFTAIIIFGAMLAVWHDHHSAFRAGGWSFIRFMRDLWAEFQNLKYATRKCIAFDAEQNALDNALENSACNADGHRPDKKHLSLMSVNSASARGSSVAWAQFFIRNQKNLPVLPWDEVYNLSHLEKNAIGKSIATFQLGESSDGHSFISAGLKYIDHSGDARYLDALKLFIAEENRHAATLGRFMEKHDLPFKKKQWTDSVFRFVRKLGELDTCITVLVTAELIAKPYYRALRDATRSCLLKEICTQILKDEEQHILFQTSTIGKLRASFSPTRLILTEIIQKLLMAGTSLVVWLEHAKVFIAAGWTFSSFLKASFQELNDALEMVRLEALSKAGKKSSRVLNTHYLAAGKSTMERMPSSQIRKPVLA